ncbi:hypothetical protein L6164_010658 [Bauhinia variegata]|uniref:Uncharacterized protein n=1 Tax=Bauhinia variegata TaxID=167791 RepID=A0ACB9PQR0_BAUVA|nr:hypothetical protein L6164_010658 [Bauhinia variegata]
MTAQICYITIIKYSNYMQNRRMQSNNCKNQEARSNAGYILKLNQWVEEPAEEWNSKGNSSEANGGKMNWMLNGGLNLGKQILVAGFVASSAPVVVPPLVVVSAIRLAASVPYGLFLASHACTEKLVSKLLPRPSSPLLFWGPYVEGGEKENGQLQKLIDLFAESNTMANDHTDPMELPVLSVEHKYRQSEYSSGDDIISSSNEVNTKFMSTFR